MKASHLILAADLSEHRCQLIRRQALPIEFLLAFVSFTKLILAIFCLIIYIVRIQMSAGQDLYGHQNWQL
jgi:hypothetical protein